MKLSCGETNAISAVVTPAENAFDSIKWFSRRRDEIRTGTA
jgi:hypothetical protein